MKSRRFCTVWYLVFLLFSTAGVLAQQLSEPEESIEKKEWLMKYHKLDTPLAELAWRAENETELRDRWVNAEVEIGVRDASKDFSIYGVNITRVFRAPDERNVDKVYGYVKIGALIKLQNDPDVLFVQIPVPPEAAEPGVVSEPPTNGSLEEAVEGAVVKTEEGISMPTLALFSLLAAIAITMLLWRWKK